MKVVLAGAPLDALPGFAMMVIVAPAVNFRAHASTSTTPTSTTEVCFTNKVLTEYQNERRTELAFEASKPLLQLG